MPSISASELVVALTYTTSPVQASSDMDTGVLVLHLQPPSVNWLSENLTAALSQAHAASMVVLRSPFVNDSEPSTCWV
jgi:hypothetical protein